jgi:hypothetical protein
MKGYIVKRNFISLVKSKPIPHDFSRGVNRYKSLLLNRFNGFGLRKPLKRFDLLRNTL